MRSGNLDPHKDFDANVHSEFVNNSPKPEGTQMPFSWWMDKQIVIILQWNTTQQWKSKLLLHTKTWTNLKSLMLNERGHTQKSEHCMIPFMWNFRKDAPNLRQQEAKSGYLGRGGSGRLWDHLNTDGAGLWSGLMGDAQRQSEEMNEACHLASHHLPLTQALLQISPPPPQTCRFLFPELYPVGAQSDSLRAW